MQNYGPPDKPVPSFIPEKESAKAMGFTKAPGISTIIPSTFKPCLLKFTYIWMNNNIQFWSKPVTIDSNSIGCWIFNGVNWNYNDVNLKDIECFMCY